MKYLNWITTIFTNQNTRSFLNMFKKKRNNRGAMIYSIVGIVASAAITAYRMNRNKRTYPAENSQNPINRLTNNIQQSFQNAKIKPLQASLNEFAKELSPQTKQQMNEITNENKQTQQ